MPSCVASACLSVRLIYNQIKLAPHFVSDLSDVWLECAQQYFPKNCGIRILTVCFLFCFSDDQAALRTLLSVCPSVCHTFFTMFLSSYHHSGLWLQFKFTDGYEMMHKPYSGIEEVPYCFSRSSVKFQGPTGRKSDNFDSKLAFPDCNSRSLRFASFN